ncbi:MAG: hypothetical protein R3C52_13270 [Hyphomonadaceae bacterium]
MKRSLILGLSLALAFTAPAMAQTNSAPQPAPYPPPVAAPADTPFPGVVKLEVDATDLSRRIFWLKQTIPAPKAGPMTLTYAKWIPGNHAPRGPVYNYAGLKITANGKPVPWTRDPVDVFSYHVDVPEGATALNVEAQFLTPLSSAQGPTMVTNEMLRLNWYVAALYPAGYFARQIPFDVTLKLPAGWDYATALETESRTADEIRFKTESWETVIDSPLIAGKHFKSWNLSEDGQSRVSLNVVGDTADMIDASASMIQTHRNLISQADKLFGARHFNHYDFLLTVSDRIATAGIEHARSSDNGVRGGYFKAWDKATVSRDLLAHEYTHSWNGKFRRPADLWTPSFDTPMRNSLLWVYEGQTQYWGIILAARSGFLTKEQALQRLADVAAAYSTRTGRDWRALADTTMDPIIAARRSLPWRDWQRSEDYYSEGLMIWLDADTLIREKSREKKSLDDFAKNFFGVRDGDWGQLTYTVDDVVKTLNKVQPYDWESFIQERVNDVAPNAPMNGFERGGYRLVYRDAPTAYGREFVSPGNLTYSIGLNAGKDGDIASVQWNSPAFEAGLAPGMTIVAVGDKIFDTDTLKDAVAATANGATIVTLTIKDQDQVRTVDLAYTGGLRYPVLERIEGTRDRLGEILKPR